MAARKGEIIYTGWSRLDTEALILPLSRTARLDVVHVRGRVTPQADTRLHRRVLQVFPSFS